MFCQFLVDRPTLSKHRMGYHRTRLRPNLSDEWEGDLPSSRFVLAAPSEVMPTKVLSQDSVIPDKKLIINEKPKMKERKECVHSQTHTYKVYLD